MTLPTLQKLIHRSIGLPGIIGFPETATEPGGGQMQRISIARAVSVNPSFIVADEAVSMLDTSVTKASFPFQCLKT